MKPFTLLLLFVLFVSNLFWLYTVLDQGVSYTYLEASMESSDKEREQLFKISNLNVIGQSVNEIKGQLNPDVYGLEPFEKEGCLYVGQVCLKLNRDSIIIRVGEAH